MNMEVDKILQWRQNVGGFNQYVGIEVMGIWEGGARAALSLRPELLNPLGMAHGGTIFALCDVAAGSAAASRGIIAVTLTSTINYLYAGQPNEQLIAVATERKHGRRTAVYEVEVTDSTSRCIASATFTMFYTEKKVEDLL